MTDFDSDIRAAMGSDRLRNRMAEQGERAGAFERLACVALAAIDEGRERDFLDAYDGVDAATHIRGRLAFLAEGHSVGDAAALVDCVRTSMKNRPRRRAPDTDRRPDGLCADTTAAGKPCANAAEDGAYCQLHARMREGAQGGVSWQQ